MNEKALVSKELNAKHAKILLGLLKLPENKECADCQSKAPRWASINLGIFICMRCSGIHRSLGVHISKVRSTTLDTWLPEQVAFMQAMGNQIANNYWEADLPLEFYRSPIETFIHAKYVDKRWASTTSPQPMPEICVEKFISTTRKEIPKKARKYSLDEEFFIKEMPKIAPTTTHSRAISSVCSTCQKKHKIVQLCLHHDGLLLSELMHQLEICFIQRIASLPYTLLCMRKNIRASDLTHKVDADGEGTVLREDVVVAREASSWIPLFCECY